ncbi:MAG: ABC transporter permease subunit [Clostridia bacterium]|nr:ABC transporter permease subunit [Clostridia bacterium]
MKANNHQRVLAGCLGLLLLAALVQAASWMKGDTLVFPGVPRILQAFFRLLGEKRTWQQVAVTLKHLAVTLAISAGAGISLGLLQGMNGFVYRLLRPAMVFLRSIPMIVLTVIIMVMTSYDRVPVAASSLILIPMISEAACEGVRRIEPELIDVYRMNSSLNLRVLGSVHLPLMAGYLRQAWQTAAGMGIRMVVTTEYLVQTKNSLGKAVFTSGYFFEYDEIYAYALIMVLLVLGLGELPGWMGRAVQKWKKEI